MTLPCAKYAPNTLTSDKAAYLQALTAEIAKETTAIATCTTDCGTKCALLQPELVPACMLSCSETCQSMATELAGCVTCLAAKSDDDGKISCAVSDDDGLTQAQIIGISVGVVLVVALIIGLVAGFAFSSPTASKVSGTQYLQSPSTASSSSSASVATPPVLR